MTKEGSFRKLVEIALEHNPELAGMEVIVEKELLHYELLHVLNRGGWLDGLTFQGGTALRLCYGGSRLSEDLDFSGGPKFSSESMEGLAAYLKETLSSQGLGVDVKNPKTMTSHFTSGIGVNTWRIAFEILPARSGIPKQMIKLDIDNSPTYTKVPGAIAQNYGVVRESRMLLHVQSREEILASKLVAFAASVVTRNRPRFRDIWDMHWLTGNGTAIRNDLVRAKMGDHRIESAWMETAASRAGGIVGSAAFAAEMRRFLLPHAAVQTLDNPLYMEFLASETERLIRTACR